MYNIIKNEWQALIHNKRLIGPLGGISLLLVVIAYFGVQDAKSNQNKKQQAKEEIRQQWESIGDYNPHGAAHYGTYTFKPTTALTALDNGINNTVGTVLQLEGHRQNEIIHSPDSQSLMLSRFGTLKPAVVLQFIIPLLLIFLAFASVSSEKEQGRLKLLLMQGVSSRKLLFSKTISYWIIGVIILLITLGIQLLLFSSDTQGDLLNRLLLLFVFYAVFYWIVCAITVYLSAALKNNTAALTSMLALWVLWVIFLPKIAGAFSEETHPLPSRQAFSAAMQEDRSKGIDGHNPLSEQEEKLKDSVLQVYNVEIVDDLPINFDGLVMQADEDFGAKVWDKHFGALETTILQQKKAYQWSGLINPFASLQSLSMGLAGTDNWHHTHFQQEAETYRRVFIKTLNDHHAFGGSKTGDWGWTANQEFYNSISDFDYETPAINQALAVYKTDMAFMGLWFIGSFFLLLFANPKNTHS
ncbi:MAG: DUF3526 domain-containing protein [Flavobacteriaceae bacterium]